MQYARSHIIFYSIIAMIISLFLSRVALSVSMIIFVTACFFHVDAKKHLQNFFSSPLLWGMTLLFLLPLLSGWWSADKNEWLNIMRIKLPLLLLPLAFAAPFTFSRKQWHGLGYILICIITAGTIWSLFHYASNMAEVNEGYLRSKTMITPLANDHVRFSWLVAVAILFTGWLLFRNKEQRIIAWALGLLIVWLIVFLHILAARTGLFSFYVILFATTLWIIFKKAKPLQGAILLVLMIGLPVVAYFILPTFRNRVKYFNYDFEYFKDAHYLPGGNDASRIISIKAGLNIVKDHPAAGVGFGDIFFETVKWYDVNYPEMLKQDKILPSNEWLIYGTGCGIPGLLVFTYAMFVPFFITVRNKWRWCLLNLIVLSGFLFDIGLEVQFGVFIYSFIVLVSWKWFYGETLKV